MHLTHHVFGMYKVDQDAMLLPVNVEAPRYVLWSDSHSELNVSASRDAAGRIHVSIVNLDPSRSAHVVASVRRCSSVAGSAQALAAQKTSMTASVLTLRIDSCRSLALSLSGGQPALACSAKVRNHGGPALGSPSYTIMGDELRCAMEGALSLPLSSAPLSVVATLDARSAPVGSFPRRRALRCFRSS